MIYMLNLICNQMLFNLELIVRKKKCFVLMVIDL
jgi:hypothetical protein